MNFKKGEIALTLNDDSSITIDPTQARAARSEKVKFTTTQAQTLFFVQFNNGSPLERAEHTALKDAPDEDQVREDAEPRTYYYTVAVFQMLRPGRLTKGTVRVAVDAGCPSIIIR